MTIDEAISWMEQPGIKAVTDGMDRHTSEAINALITVAKEFNVLRKAYFLACKELGVISDDSSLCNATELFCGIDEQVDCARCWREYYLMRARGEE